MTRNILMGLIGFGALIEVGCQPRATDQAKAAIVSTPVASGTIKVIHPEKKDVRRVIERPGYNIEPFERTSLSAKISGYISKWNFDMGDHVRQGDILAELSIPEMNVDLRRKETTVTQATSEIKQAEASVVRAEAELARAKAQYDRLSRMTGVIDKEQADEYRLGVESAQAALAKVHADVEVAKARLKGAEADRDHIETLLLYTKIRAPYDAVVTKRLVNTGDFVQPATGKGEALFVIERIRPVRVFVHLPELEAAWVKKGDSATIRVQSLGGALFRGTVTRTSNSLDPRNRTLSTEIDLPNEDSKLQPGMFVSATIVVEHRNVWSLPSSAVVVQDEQTFCYQVENGKAVRRDVQIRLRGNSIVEVLKIASSQPATGQALGWADPIGNENFVENAILISGDGQSVQVTAPN